MIIGSFISKIIKWRYLFLKSSIYELFLIFVKLFCKLNKISKIVVTINKITKLKKEHVELNAKHQQLNIACFLKSAMIKK